MKQNVLPVTIKYKGCQGDVSHRQKKMREAKINVCLWIGIFSSG